MEKLGLKRKPRFPSSMDINRSLDREEKFFANDIWKLNFKKKKKKKRETFEETGME